MTILGFTDRKKAHRFGVLIGFLGVAVFLVLFLPTFGTAVVTNVLFLFGVPLLYCVILEWFFPRAGGLALIIVGVISSGVYFYLLMRANASSFVLFLQLVILAASVLASGYLCFRSGQLKAGKPS